MDEGNQVSERREAVSIYLFGKTYFVIFVNEGCRDTRHIALKNHDTAIEATGIYRQQMLRERASVICISGNRGGKLGRSERVS